MSSPLTLWTSQLEWDFHTSVAELQKVTDIPAEARYYRGDEPSTSDKHILSFRDELQFADNLAFLCHWHEGGYYISAVTLRECHDHLIIQVASNLTPSPAIIEGLKDLMGMLAQYASQSTMLIPSRSKIYLTLINSQRGIERNLVRCFSTKFFNSANSEFSID